MADEKVLNVAVVSAEKALWSGQAKSLVAKTPEGDIGILPNHEPVLALLVLGSMALEGPALTWAATHRKHHALSDKPGDPHSPHVGHGDGVLGAIRGFLHAHVGWLFANLGMEQGREYGSDLYDDRLIRLIDRAYLLWVGLTLGLPFAIGKLGHVVIRVRDLELVLEVRRGAQAVAAPHQAGVERYQIHQGAEPQLAGQ